MPRPDSFVFGGDSLAAGGFIITGVKRLRGRVKQQLSFLQIARRAPIRANVAGGLYG